MKKQIELIKAPNQIELLFSGAPLNEGKKALFLYFALDAEKSLRLAPFNQPIAHLNENFPNIRTASISLPFHEDAYPLEEAMPLWGEAFKENPNFLNEFVKKASDAIDFLVEKKIADSEQIGLGGLSRGGYVAALLGEFRGCRALLAFAPLTDLSRLTELGKLPQEVNSAKLIKADIRAYIGNRDSRVGTRSCFNWIESLTEKQAEAGIRSPTVEMIISPSIGHKGHGTPEAIFKAGAEWMGKKLTFEVKK